MSNETEVLALWIGQQAFQSAKFNSLLGWYDAARQAPRKAVDLIIVCEEHHISMPRGHRHRDFDAPCCPILPSSPSSNLLSPSIIVPVTQYPYLASSFLTSLSTFASFCAVANALLVAFFLS